MKKKFLLFIAMMMVFIIFMILLLQYRHTTTKGKTDHVLVEYGKSQKFDRQEIETAVDCVLEEFETYRSGDLRRLWYDEDISNNRSGFDNINEITLLSDFYIGDLGYSQGFDNNTMYKEYEWSLVRDSKFSKWVLKSCGYA